MGRSAADATAAMLGRLACGLVLVAPVVLLNVAPGGTVVTTSARVTVNLFSDSLGWQARGFLKDDLNASTTRFTSQGSFPGLAPCDDLKRVEALTHATAPTIAVLQFSGDRATRCMKGVTTTKQVVVKYTRDLDTIIGLLLRDGTRYVIVDRGPLAKHTYTWFPAILKMYGAIVATWNSPRVLYAHGADADVETPKGAFTMTLPCLPVEVRYRRCEKGSSIEVRSSDGLHFCPVLGAGLSPCPVYASGAFRFAHGFARLIWTLDKATKPA